MLKKDYDLRNGWNEIIIDIKMNIKITKTKSNYDLFFRKKSIEKPCIDIAKLD